MVVNPKIGENIDTSWWEVPANSVPAAAVIQKGLALFKIIGRKGLLGGILYGKNNIYIDYKKNFLNIYTLSSKEVGRISRVGVKSV